MRYNEIFRVLGNFLFYFSFLFALPMSVAAYYEFIEMPEEHPQPHSSLAFLLSFICSIFLASIFRFLGRSATGLIFRRESILVVLFIWTASALVAALPFYFSGTLTNPLDAYFESMSGLTTTGASLITPKAFAEGSNLEIPISIPNGEGGNYSYFGTIPSTVDPNTGQVLTGLEAVSRAILVWRSFLQWLGGMGIVVLFLTFLPALGIGGKTLYQTEMTGPIQENISPRLKETASFLWKLYISLSIVELFLLLLTNHSLPFLDALCITFSNLSTGGFAMHAESIAYYNNIYTEWIVILFMILGSLNFSIYFHLMQKKLHKIYGTDFFLFCTLLLLGSLITSYFLIGSPNQRIGGEGVYSAEEALRSGLFHWISSQSSTGYFLGNYDAWPISGKMFFLLAMFLGGMAGSTSGGMKTTRYYLFSKIASNQLEGLFRPEAIRVVRFGKLEVDTNITIMVLFFFSVGFFSSVLGATLFVITGIDLETSIGLVSCFINNVGTAFGAAGPLHSMNFLSPFGKILAIFWMLLGRLEYFAILVLFFPGFWMGR